MRNKSSVGLVETTEGLPRDVNLTVTIGLDY